MTQKDPLYRNPVPSKDDEFTAPTSPSRPEDAPQFAGDPTDVTSWEKNASSTGSTVNDSSGTGLGGKTGDLASKAQEKTGDVAGKAEELTGKAQEKAGELGSKAQDKADQGMDAAASGLGQAADVLRQ